MVVDKYRVSFNSNKENCLIFGLGQWWHSFPYHYHIFIVIVKITIPYPK